ncbi:site-specific integrase [Streptomyces sp. CB01201]|uniref:site-specific integrase n=1 Tax=Streptomyces sp. CB01201 TaxID=2020324 RepID=UPI000C26F564|nr:site-specific integrase [Streptomyces sp. CB01201]PJN00858.1 site-specific integrase [Streptomyces sp. CB01201]
MAGYIEDRWLNKRKDPVTGKRERTALWGKCKRYKVSGIPGVRSRSFDVLEEAKIWKAKAIIDSKRKEFVDDRDGAILLGDYIENEWWPTRSDPAGTAITMKSKIWRHVIGTALGRQPMNVIGDRQLVNWQKELRARGLEAYTIEVIWNHLSSIFKSATGSRIAKNPCREAGSETRPPKAGETKARAWLPEEVLAIRNGLADRYQVVADLGMGAGLRQAEVIGFSLDDIDESRMLITLRRQLLWENSSRPYFKLPKGKKERNIPLSAGLLKAIKAHAEKYPPVTVTLPWQGPGNDGRKEASVGLLVTTAYGNRINPSVYNNKNMKPALVSAGLLAPRSEDGKEGWGWEPSRERMHHRFRHTYASVQLQAGEDPVSLSHWMGHASPETTFRIYAHFMPDRGQRGRTAIDAWLQASTR